jgi:hypothetical protein
MNNPTRSLHVGCDRQSVAQTVAGDAGQQLLGQSQRHFQRVGTVVVIGNREFF